MINSNQPLATRLRPRSLSEVVGQEDLIGDGKVLTRMVNSGVLSSIILYGPPGVGKTSIASALSQDLNRKFEYFNASVHSKKDLENATKGGTVKSPTVVLIDEVHRLTKPNQDYLLMMLEEGSVTMVGATTENPYMSISPAMRSRTSVFELKPVTAENVEKRLKIALEDKVLGLGEFSTQVEDGVLSFISGFTNGDLRAALNTLELAVVSTDPDDDGIRTITLDTAQTCLQSKQVGGDKNGDSHYNMLSAFQKSIRGSDVDASLHYLARLIKVGDLVSINRRLLVIAYEDIGLANPDLVAETLASIESTERVGFPEARIILSYIVIRLAMSRKSNVAYKAIKLAEKALDTKRDTSIPKSLHDTHYKGAKKLGKGEGYKYAHNYPYGVIDQKFIPESFENDRYLIFRGDDDTPAVQETYDRLNKILKKKKYV